MLAVVKFARALADETRWRIIRLIHDEPLCVCELADILKMPQSSVSSHLQIIRKAGLLASERREKWIYYRVEVAVHPLIASIGSHFSVSVATDTTLAKDSRMAVKRLAQREASCCPGPRKLASTARKKLCP
ncbi:MAG: hypothetical protein RL693_1773 [Verrucomicrobiota bacterium]|jgi:ArsR family transcriptional regulator